jgi:hypothetical protein
MAADEHSPECRWLDDVDALRSEIAETGSLRGGAYSGRRASQSHCLVVTV